MSREDQDKQLVEKKAPILIKKYPNRRLYNTSTSSYIVLEDIIKLVQSEIDFVIEDKKSGEDITRSILNQIIFEQETKPSDYHFPLEVQKQLISMYGDAYGKLVPNYLKESMGLFAAEREKMREAVESVAGKNAKALMDYSQALAKQNMELFQRSMNLFAGSMSSQSTSQKQSNAKALNTQQDGANQAHNQKQVSSSELEAIQAQIDALQERLKNLK